MPTQNIQTQRLWTAEISKNESGVRQESKVKGYL